MNIIKQIKIYGDSLMKGILMDNHKYSIVKENNIASLQNIFPLYIDNKSRFGNTIEQGYEQIKKDISKGIDCDFALLEYGGNDCDFHWADISADPDAIHLPNTPIEKFKSIYCEIISLLRSKGITPILMSLPPINAKKYFDWFTQNGLSKESILKWLGSIDVIYRYQEMYSNTVTKIAFETSSPLVDVRMSFLDKHYPDQYLCDDGIHPNKDGYALIKDVFINFINSNKSLAMIR